MFQKQEYRKLNEQSFKIKKVEISGTATFSVTSGTLEF